MMQREIIAAKEMEGKLDGSSSAQGEIAEAKRKRRQIQTHEASLRLELIRQKIKMQHMVDFAANSSTVREEAVLLHLLHEGEGKIRLNELKHETI
ncbi:hypothetical protein PsorP6_016399 [Peronosclerospora sorghi]|uniref:Uncharacterized protein n=1 Tax=Peronosclerospora sorghi TaxID=230839 RepID=A0ACC0VLI5_9STRA|nr:hypothetical protein PsorP6_016399 [Peronosclerospora sorghi]